MKKTFLAALVLIAALSACAKYDAESDFETEISEDGKSVIITGYLGSKENVRIPPRIQKLPVTHIDDWSFCEYDLTSVTIPNSVTYIGVGAFAENLLTSVTIGKSVTHIDDWAFAGNELTRVLIPSDAYIGDGAFDDNPLTTITVGKNIVSIDDLPYLPSSIEDRFRAEEGTKPQEEAKMENKNPGEMPESIKNAVNNAPEDVLVGVGKAKLTDSTMSMTFAENDARVDIARQISTITTEIVRTYSTRSNVDPSQVTIFQETITTSLSKANLVGATAVARALGDDGTWWYVVTMSKSNVINQITAAEAEAKAAVLAMASFDAEALVNEILK